jgi:4-amino-4-deoxy-L-arabinose transferase-like glycosyltransferase
VRSLPGIAWLCALAGLLSALAWSFVTPPFHVPDEVAHVAYVQHLAETAELPKLSDDLSYAPEEQQALTVTEFYLVVGAREGRPPWTAHQQRAIEGLPELARVGTGTAQSATNNPPLYYALEAGPYWLGSGLSLLDRMVLMRLLSALMAGATALTAFLFVREVLPGMSWAWTVGGMAVALQPLFGFISSGVQPDALLALTGALVLLGAARVLQRGLDPRTGALLGAATAAGLLSKLAFVGLVPGVVLAVAIGLRRTTSARRRGPGLRGAALALGIPAGVVALYVLASAVIWDRPLYAGEVPTAGGAAGAAAGSLPDQVSYIWQLYLPPLPFMEDKFSGSPIRNVWLHGFIGRFGWLDTAWSPTVYWVGTLVLLGVALLAAVEVFRGARRGALTGRLGELAVYATTVLGLLLLIGVSGYPAHLEGTTFEQARYLLPLLAIYGVVVALAARSVGPRWGPVLGAALVAVAFGHDLFAQLLTVGRFWA